MTTLLITTTITNRRDPSNPATVRTEIEKNGTFTVSLYLSDPTTHQPAAMATEATLQAAMRTYNRWVKRYVNEYYN